jgi:nucleoside-diphosphate-sugar epimerase
MTMLIAGTSHPMAGASLPSNIRKEESIFSARMDKRRRRLRYIDDCIRGVQLIMNSEILEPINLGSSEMVSINQLVDLVENIAGVKLRRKYDLNAPKGVNGRNSDNTLIKKLLNWEPSIPLRTGLERTYAWIYDQYMAREREQRLHQRKPDNTLSKAASSFLPGAA